MVQSGMQLSSQHEKNLETREPGQTRRYKDGTFTKKNNRTYFGYKAHILTDDNIG